MLPMLNQTARIISTYSADTFGVCSTFFELNGMIVIHDPSGCNSTYTTHDEPRWYTQDAKIYVSALNEQDAVLGRDERFLKDVIETVHQQQPHFVCLIPSQIAFLISTDMKALAKIVAEKTGIPTFTLPTNSMHYYERGIYFAMEKLARHVTGTAPDWPRETPLPAKTPASHELSVNLLGITPQDYSINGSDASIRDWLTREGFAVQSCWSLNTTLESIESAPSADVNLVLSYGGLGAARVLQEVCGIPYVIGVPIAPLQEELAEALRETAETGHTRAPYLSYSPYDDFEESGLLIGESVYAQSLAYALEQKTNRHYTCIIPMETEPILLRQDTLRATDEKDLQPLFDQAKDILGDPMYAPILPETARFIPLPHEGFSGRLYEPNIPNLIDADGFASFLAQIVEKPANASFLS